jgi:hypothetical protein
VSTEMTCEIRCEAVKRTADAQTPGANMGDLETYDRPLTLDRIIAVFGQNSCANYCPG